MTLQRFQQRLGAIVVESHPVQRGLLLRQSEQAWFGVARLAMPGDRAHFGEAKAKAIPDPSRDSVLVKPRRQTHRVGEAAAKQHLFQAQITPLQIRRNAIQHRGHPWPAAPQAGLTKSRERSARQLFRIQTVVPRQDRAKPTLIKGTAAERSGRRGRRHALAQDCSDPASRRCRVQRPSAWGSTIQSLQIQLSALVSSCLSGFSTSCASSSNERL